MAVPGTWQAKYHYVLNVLQGPNKGAQYELGWAPASLGRAKDNRVVLRDKLISRCHGEWLRVRAAPSPVR